MEKWLYAHQEGLTPAAVRRAASDIGRVNDFDSQFSQVVDLIKSDVDFARQFGVRAMPTFFINGVRIEGGLKPGFLDQAIAHELRVHVKP